MAKKASAKRTQIRKMLRNRMNEANKTNHIESNIPFNGRLTQTKDGKVVPQKESERESFLRSLDKSQEINHYKRITT
jgi:hypothetical protein